MPQLMFPAVTKCCRIGSRLFLAILFSCMTAAVAESAVVTLAWNPNPETDIAGYALSYGTTSGQLTTMIDVGNTTTYAFAIPDPTKVYYLALRAYNTRGLFSPFSNEVATTPIVPALTVTNVVANLPSPQPPGTTITFSATATGGTAPYQYKWWISNGTTSTLGRDWSTSNTFAWTPSAPGPTYTITVWARNASSTIDNFDNPSAKLSLSFAIGSATAAPVLTSLSPSLAAIGAPVTITGSNFGDAGNEYCHVQRRAGRSEQLVRHDSRRAGSRRHHQRSRHRDRRRRGQQRAGVNRQRTTDARTRRQPDERAIHARIAAADCNGPEWDGADLPRDRPPAGPEREQHDRAHIGNALQAHPHLHRHRYGVGWLALEQPHVYLDRHQVIAQSLPRVGFVG